MSDTSKVSVPLVSAPHFQKEALEIALQMSRFSVEELARLLHVNTKIAIENSRRYYSFLHTESGKGVPALLAYTGIVFKRLNPQAFSADTFEYAQQHLRLTSFCYGLLRPLDVIRPYRLEGNVVLPELEEQNMFAYWRPRLTALFIQDIQRTGGVLCNLASDEMKGLFDWKQVEQSVNIVTPEFYVWKNGRPTTVVIYTKMCRGEMARFILENRIESWDELRNFSWEGFEYDHELSDEKRLAFVCR